MKHNPFVPREWRTAILTFDNGHRARAEVLLPGTDKPVWHADLERRLVRDFNKSQPHAVHKVVKYISYETKNTYNYEENQDMAHTPSGWSNSC